MVVLLADVLLLLLLSVVSFDQVLALVSILLLFEVCLNLLVPLLWFRALGDVFGRLLLVILKLLIHLLYRGLYQFGTNLAGVLDRLPGLDLSFF